jgi:hypothetical protein
MEVEIREKSPGEASGAFFMSELPNKPFGYRI